MSSRIESISKNDAGQLVVRMRGQEQPFLDVRVARCFPWSLPGGYISVRDKDGKEIALFETLEELDPVSRDIVEAELQDKVFNPRVLRIIEHSNEFGVISIKAETNRGIVTFQIRSRDDIRYLSGSRALFRDADGNIYEIADFSKLDPDSRRLLQSYF